ncbi:MAG: hypothetical protein LAO79_06700 [Acidobacteriia bacterium]|nr:hypothetical protein [Terriglobia bacterium]
MPGTTQAGYYVWEVPGKPVTVHLHLDVVDRMLAEVMRGFGAVPKRGAEVGGVLIGSIEHGDHSIVRIEDFEPVECDYKRGPSYLFTDTEAAAFQQAVRRWQPDATRPDYAVGFYRSHTRDGLALAPEDIQLMDEYFPSPSHVALVIKPYGTKVSLAGFFIREDRGFPDTTPLEFPFRRRELAGDEPPPRRSMLERRPRERNITEMPRSEFQREMEYTPPGYTPMESMPSAGPAYAVTLPSKSRLRSAIWIPLSFVFLLFGIALGMMVSLTRVPGGSRAGAEDFSLGLSISKNDDNLSVRWDRQSPAIHTAQRGVLEIEDGSYTKSVDLDTAQLQNGSIIYRNSSGTVRFRLIVYPRARVSVTETMDWKQ